MKEKFFVFCVLAGLVGCAQQQVAESLQEAAVVEGREYAAEMQAQSPFRTLEMHWSEAAEQMEHRNPNFIAAQRTHQQAVDQSSEFQAVTSQLRGSMTSSIRGALNPGAMLASMRNPAIELPKQLASISTLKDISHNVSQDAWKGASTVVDAELAMRQERVKLHRLLRIGQQIDRETERTNATAAASGEEVDAEFAAAMREWRGELRNAREAWLTEVRDFFDAEYHDVRFIPDDSGLPTYREVHQPDLADWERWCQLTRSKELVDSLAKSHADSKPAIPGSNAVIGRLSSLASGGDDDGAGEVVRESSAVRREVRTLVQSWRSMKRAQHQADQMEATIEDGGIATVADIHKLRRIHQLRMQEIEHAAKVWMMDEQCWG